MRPGAHYRSDGSCQFVVWAPLLQDLAVKILAPRPELVPMTRDPQGYWSVTVKHLPAGTLYFLSSAQCGDKPDPASSSQPQGIHGPSEVTDHSRYRWHDQAWRNIALSQMIMYELHVGTFTPGGTFESVIPRLDELKDLGVNAIELMPVAQFLGTRNWGYDGVDLFAVQNSYGGVEGLKKLVDACHQKGVAVILDVVYNHLGPEGNYLDCFGPYFTSRHHTPWGKAINFDDAHNEHVRRFFISNALYWYEHFHVDALRLDAIHAIYDQSPRPFLQQLAEEVDAWCGEKKRNVYLIPESALNDVKVVQAREEGGYGLHAQWSEDFHHSLHAFLTGERGGFYQDYGPLEDVATALRESFVYQGQYSSYHGHNFGTYAGNIPAERFVVFLQNHDMVGNRRGGERLARLLPFEAQKMVAGFLLFAPYVPLLFMGEEYAEENPFYYFVSHSELELIEAVRAGRKREFAAFQWEDDASDPQEEETFLASKLGWEKRRTGRHAVMLAYYRELIALRKSWDALNTLERKNMEVVFSKEDNILWVRRWGHGSEVVSFFSFNKTTRPFSVRIPEGQWRKIVDSRECRWAGTGEVLETNIKGKSIIQLQPFQFAAFAQGDS